MQLHISNSIALCNPLSYVSYTEQGRGDSETQTKLQQ